MNLRTKSLLAAAVLVLTGCALPAIAADVPAVLPDPDGRPGDSSRPVKVYLLAGQSNMVGMGQISGAKNMYAGAFYTADQAATKGSLNIYKVGIYKIGSLAVYGADGKPTDKPVAEGSFEVAEKGVYRVCCGCNCGRSAVQVEGKPAGGEMTLDAGKRYRFAITGYTDDPPYLWLRKMDLLGYGDLEATVKREGKFPWLVDDKGEWTVRKDVYFYDARIHFKGSDLNPSSNGKTIGPELGFGHVLGTFHDEQVLLIKTSMGNRALGFDFRPPSSGRTDPDNEWESKEYRLMVEGVRKTLAQIDKIVPGYKGQGYEMAGFVWWQGHKDGFSPELIAEYEKNLINLINDVRKEFDAPKMPAVVATVGFGGHNMQDKYLAILKAQMAVADPKKHPELAGTVATVDIRDFWREVDESPKGEGHHYNRNAETYMLVGDALGRAMVNLKGAAAAALPQAPRPKRAQAGAGEMTDAQKAAAQKALAPIILGGIAREYVTNPRYSKALAAEVAGERPQRANQFLRGAMYGLLNCYRAAGIHDYDWKVFGKDWRDEKWQYYSFDPPEALDKNKNAGRRYREVTFPKGMENWTSPEFDAAKAGWKTGLPPFGQAAGKAEPLRGCTRDGDCGCGEKPRTLWTNEVLAVRGTFEVPALKEGHRYRIVVGGSNHVNTGEGYAIYVNGKLLVESKTGVPNRQGGQPRGGDIYADFLDEFKGGKVTIAAVSFLRYGKDPSPQGHLTLWIEQQKVPPLAAAAKASN